MQQYDFIDVLSKAPLVMDGAAGTALLRKLSLKNIKYQKLLPILSIEMSEIIYEIHKEFAESGANIIETNTFLGDSISLSSNDLAFKTNKISAEIASSVKKFYPKKVIFIAGSVGPTILSQNYLNITQQELIKAYIPQIEGLVEGGVDLIKIETVTSLFQVESALKATREVFTSLNIDMPIIVQISPSINGELFRDATLKKGVKILESYGVSVFGLNCGFSPEDMILPLKKIKKEWSRLIAVTPNAGIPSKDNPLIYPIDKTEFSRYALSYINDLGVNIVGGCCGVFPEYIAFLTNELRSLKLYGNFSCLKRENSL